MKTLKFRYTDHGSYSLARSFFMTIGLIILVSIADLLWFYVPINFLALGTFGTVIRVIFMLAGAFAGMYLGFRASCSLFDREGTIILNNDSIEVKIGRKSHKIYITEIESVEMSVFAKYDGLRFKASKALGPLFTNHTIMTTRGELSVMASAKEGWEKAGKDIFGRESPTPTYSIDDAFAELSSHVDKLKKATNQEGAEEA